MHKSTQKLDLNHLAAQTGGDYALQREILSLFVRQSREILGLLQDGADTPRVHADLAHKLKGSARTVGAFALAEAAETVEADLRTDHIRSAALGALAAAVEAAHAEISRYLTSVSHDG